MRLPCIPLFLAVAIRPIVVDAHDKPSDIATPDGQLEVQSHLRVQERANGISDDERMSPVPEELISTALQDDMDILTPMIRRSGVLTHHEGSSDVTNMNLNARKRKIKMLDSQKEIHPKKGKRPKERLPAFLDDLYAAQKMEQSDKLDKAISLPETNTQRLFVQANKHFLKEEKDPKEVFDLYLLPYAKEELFNKVL